MCIYIYNLLYQNLRVTTNQKSKIDTQKNERRSHPNTTLKVVIKIQEKKIKEDERKNLQKSKIINKMAISICILITTSSIFIWIKYICKWTICPKQKS